MLNIFKSWAPIRCTIKYVSLNLEFFITNDFKKYDDYNE